jgi:hypothetical protein
MPTSSVKRTGVADAYFPNGDVFSPVTTNA